MKTALIIGAGPAGLMAADALSVAGHHVIVAEAKSSVARKFLMAGKSGLNLTKNEPQAQFETHYGEAADFLRPMLQQFGPKQAVAWATGLGQEMFTGSTGRVFPKRMKASPLLRAWLARLATQGVEIRTRHRCIRSTKGYVFETPDGQATLSADCCVFACGGASWAKLGSDGAWADWLDVPLTAFQPANMGFAVDWSPHMERHFGQPVKNVALHAGLQAARGEFILSRHGIEGGGIYAVARAMRNGADLHVDLLPEVPLETLRARLMQSRGKASLSNFLRKTVKLEPIKQALLMEFGRPLPDDLASLIKALPISHQGPRPIDQAISTAGGIQLAALTTGLMLRDQPGVFAAGEMLDWEAPTGGYLLTACLATGLWAGQHAANYLAKT